MISFIVIGKNEGWRLTKCLISILNVIKEDNIIDSEIIYVDSKSTDDSIERVTSFDSIEICKITGECNQAIGRNIGALEAKGDILFFIDGDMQILPGFLPTVIDDGNKMTYPFLSGIFEDYVYDENWNFIEVQKRLKISETMNDSYETITGGLFIIERGLFKAIGGMDNRLFQCEDMDLGLCLSKLGIPLLRKPYLLALHHTISYTNSTRKTSFIKSAIFSAVLSRKHILNPQYYSLFLRTQYTVVGLIFSFLLSMLISPYFICLYVMLLFTKTFRSITKSKVNYFEMLGLFFCRDCFFLVSFFLYYPKGKKCLYETSIKTGV